MFIDERAKNKLLTWNDTEPIYKQFEKKCAMLSRLSYLIINPNDYQLQYKLHEASLEDFIDLQTKLYGFLYKKYPNVEFGMSGRFKSPFSHYEKVIRKFVDLFQKDEFKPVEILDDYAIKVFLLSINYPIDKVSIDSEGIYVDCGPDEFRILSGDAFEFSYKNQLFPIVVEKNASNVWVNNSIPYIHTTRNNQELNLPLNTAITYKKSSKEDLVKYCYDFQKDIENFYAEEDFKTKKRKDYIAHEKLSGYASLHCSLYSKEQGLGLECQIRTHDMERFNNVERTYGYKPLEHTLSNNSLSKLPHFILTTRFADGYTTYKMSDAECFEYVYGISLKEYRKQIKPTLQEKKTSLGKNDGAR
ncbi:MAG: hypothetical protein HFJ27_02870 [Clostridia bacterium]|nr:hypothetical protein [Clostridia bacterium]